MRSSTTHATPISPISKRRRRSITTKSGSLLDIRRKFFRFSCSSLSAAYRHARTTSRDRSRQAPDEQPSTPTRRCVRDMRRSDHRLAQAVDGGARVIEGHEAGQRHHRRPHARARHRSRAAAVTERQVCRRSRLGRSGRPQNLHIAVDDLSQHEIVPSHVTSCVRGGGAPHDVCATWFVRI